VSSNYYDDDFGVVQQLLASPVDVAKRARRSAAAAALAVCWCQNL
jgi:hypothetical protein